MKELNESPDNVRNYEEPIPVVKEYDTIIKFLEEENSQSCVEAELF